VLGSFYNSTLYLALRRGIETSNLRQKVYANNLANANTPHFKRSEVNFEDQFKQALERDPRRLVGFVTDEKHIAINPPMTLDSVQPGIWRQNDDFVRSDDNNVDVDVESAELAKNELQFNALVEGLNRKIHTLQRVIRR
jgi:flagellar basal-body rod protein FlgB